AHNDPVDTVPQGGGHDHAARPFLADLADSQVTAGHVGKEHLDGRVRTGKVEPGGLAHDAAPAVAPNNEAAAQSLAALRCFGVEVHTVAIVGQAHGLPAP